MRVKIMQNGSWYNAENVKAYYNGKWSHNKINPLKLEVETAFFIDCGRKYFTIGWLKGMIDEISAIGYNTLIIHFSEDMGLRLESKLYPWLAGSDSTLCTQGEIVDADHGKYYTQDEMKDIVNYAHGKGISVVPSFDSPGHMNYIVKKYNEYYNSDIGNYYHYNEQTHIVEGSGNNNYSRGIDISNPDAVSFVKSLITEYAQFYYDLGCKSFDMGGDELLGWGSAVTYDVPKWKQLDHWKTYAIERTGNNNAVAYDAFILYLNDTSKLLRKIGYTETRIWNDQILIPSGTDYSKVVELDRNISVQYWIADNNTALK